MRFPRKTLIVMALVLVSGAPVIFLYDHFRSRVIFGLREDFSKAVPYDTPVPGIPGIRAEQCGICHREIYQEWKTSYHAQAYVDPFFQAYWQKDRNIWICLNCHSPMQPQQPWKILGLEGGKIHKPIREDNPEYDPEFQKEGITCAACHVREGVIEGPFEDSKAPHPTRYSPRFRTTEICFTCHQVPSGPFQFYNGGPCSTFPEFEAGPYAKRGMICQDCHMPSVDRPAAEGGPVRSTRRHLWRGGHSPEMIRQAVTIQASAGQATYQPGDTARYKLTLANSGAGHKIPTGDPDRYFTVTFEVLDGNGKILRRQEETMRRWIVWWPVIWEVYENRLAPLASRVYDFEVRLPDRLEGAKVRAKVQYHIMTEGQYRNLKKRYGLSVEVPYVFTIYEQEFPLDAPARVVENQLHPGSSSCEGGKKSEG